MKQFIAAVRMRSSCTSAIARAFAEELGDEATRFVVGGISRNACSLLRQGLINHETPNRENVLSHLHGLIGKINTRMIILVSFSAKFSGRRC